MKPKDLADEYGVTAMRIGRIRKEKWKKRAHGDLTDEQVAYIRSKLERQTPPGNKAEEHIPKVVDVVITHQGHGRYAECMERGKPGRFRFLKPFGAQTLKEQTVTKGVRVRENGTELYIHASLARQPWEYVNE